MWLSSKYCRICQIIDQLNICFSICVFVVHLNHHAARTRDSLVKDTSPHGLIYEEGNLAALTCMDVALM